MLTDSEMDLFERAADIVARSVYHGFPIHIGFTCPICSGTAEVIRKSPLRGIAQCPTCHVVLARGRIPEK